MIICHGCSFTEGYNLQNKISAWPKQLEEISNTITLNHALGGSSNQRISRVLKEDLVNLSSIDMVIVGWTSNSRNEIFSSDGDYIRATAGGCIGEKTDNSKNIDMLSQLHKNWLFYNYNQWLNYRQLIYDILFFQNYFESKKIKYKFFSAFESNMINDFLSQNDDSLMLANNAWAPWDTKKFAPDRSRHIDWNEMIELVKKINLENWILQNQETMIDFLTRIGIAERDPGGHPLENGHRAWAELIFSEIS